MEHTLPQLAAMTGIPYDTLRTWRRRGWMRPSYKSGNRERFTLEAVNEAKARSVVPQMPMTATTPRYEF